MSLTSENLLSWHRFEEASGDRLDSHHLGKTLSQVNTPTRETGVQNFAVGFTVAAQNYLTRTDADYNMGNISFSFGFWYRFATADVWYTLFGKHANSNGKRGWEVFRERTPARIRFSLSADGTALTTLENTVGLVDATWYFICARYNSSTSRMHLTVNSTAVNVAHSGGAFANNETFRIGASNQGDFAMTYTNGRIDEGFVYKNRFLSDAEVTWLFNSGAGRQYSDLTHISARQVIMM